MRIVVVEPFKCPEVKAINNTLESMQQLVGGTIQAIYPFDDPVAIIANDEGKIQGLLPNRGLCDDDGELYDIICGSFFVCGLTEDNFGSLTEEQVERFTKEYETPELFLKLNGEIVSLPLTTTEAEEWRKEYEG